MSVCDVDGRGCVAACLRRRGRGKRKKGIHNSVTNRRRCVRLDQLGRGFVHPATWVRVLSKQACQKPEATCSVRRRHDLTDEVFS